MQDIADILRCHLVKAVTQIAGKQGLNYNVGISAETVGSVGIHLQLVTIPPLARARASQSSSTRRAACLLRCCQI